MVPKLVNFFSFLQIDWLIIDRLCNWIWFFCQKKRQPLLIFFLMWIFDKVDFCLILQQVLLIVLVSFSWVFHFLILSQVFLHSFSKLFKIDKIFSVILNFFSNFCVCVFFCAKPEIIFFFRFRHYVIISFSNRLLIDRSIYSFIQQPKFVCQKISTFFSFHFRLIDWLIDFDHFQSIFCSVLMTNHFVCFLLIIFVIVITGNLFFVFFWHFISSK